jgi:hypothetical protein
MGVMACDRKGCNNIMCKIMTVDQEYYICNECYEEFNNHMKIKGMFKGYKRELMKEIPEFMATEKKDNDHENDDCTKSEEEDGLVTIKSLFLSLTSDPL